MTQG